MVYEMSDIVERVADAVSRYNSTAERPRQIERVSLFGSYANGVAADSSDVDLLVGFISPCVSLFTLARAREAFEEALGKEVDLVQYPIPAGSCLSTDGLVAVYG